MSASDYIVLPQGEGQGAVSCERGNQLAGCIKDRELRIFFYVVLTMHPGMTLGK